MTSTDAVDPGSFTEINVRSTAEQIADQLRRAILYGSVQSGASLTEVDVAQRFGVSRGPIREAMQRLLQEGLLVRTSSRAVRVVSFSDSDMKDVYFARRAVEHAAVEAILDHDPAAAVAALNAILDQMLVAAKADDLTTFTTMDVDFHNTLVRHAGSVRLLRMQSTLLVEAHMCMVRLERKYADPIAAVAEHRLIVDALAARDRAAARHAVDSHMDNAIALLTQSKVQP